jgi:hypothetical protein
MERWIDQELAGCAFADERLGRRFGMLMEQLAKGIGRTIPLACGDWAATKAAYRFLLDAPGDQPGRADRRGGAGIYPRGSQLPIEERYKGTLGSDTMVPLDRGTARDMLAKERFLESTLPGPDNNTPWANAAKARGGTPVALTIDGKPLNGGPSPCP